ncbi:ankyrin repeat-containing domain protein [Tirmania nivea]|nr:ankyrin repeat-containing domain protein [Tirmania nivea]
MRLLLERNDVDINATDNNGRSPLSLAAGRGHEAVVRLLLERNDVDVDSNDKYGRPPLLWAAGRGHEAVVRLLLEHDNINLTLRTVKAEQPSTGLR